MSYDAFPDFIQEPEKKNPKPKNRTNSTKHFSEQCGGTTQLKKGFDYDGVYLLEPLGP